MEVLKFCGADHKLIVRGGELAESVEVGVAGGDGLGLLSAKVGQGRSCFWNNGSGGILDRTGQARTELCICGRGQAN